MRIAILVLILSTQVAAAGVEFRGVELGQSCRAAAKLELALGTQPKFDLDLMIAQGIIVFEDLRTTGQHAQLLYKCPENRDVISLYSINLKTRSESTARDLYATAVSEVVARLGEPRWDTQSTEAQEKLRVLREKGLTSNYAVADWSSDAHEHISVVLEKVPVLDGEWSVTTFVTAERDKSQDASPVPGHT